MRPLRAWLIRFAGFFSRDRRERELNDEMESHLALHIEDNIRAGMTLAEARRAALVRFGGIEAVKESYRDRRGIPLLDTMAQDVRYAVRTLHRNAGFATVAILTLALGIGANTAVFSVVQAVLLRPLPYAQPDRLIEVSETNPLKRWTHSVAAPANYADWRRMNTVFSGMAAYNGIDEKRASSYDLFLTGAGEPQRVTGLTVTGNLFHVLGVTPLLGRTFTEEETYEGHERVAILSYGFWQTEFAGDPHIIGRTLTLSGKTYDVIGVMPREFFFPNREVQIFLPFGVKPAFFVQMRRPHMLYVIARLRQGVSIDRARGEMTAIASRLERTYPYTNTKMGVRLDGYHAVLSQASRPAVLMLLGAVGLLLLIVCSNVANLQLGRAAAREREMGIRQALGAGRFRLIRQLLTESMMLSFAGGALGLVLAVAARAALLRLAPAAIPGFAELRIDLWVILFTGAITLCAPLLFGVIPAIASSRPDALRDRSESASRASRSLRDLLVACEVALSVVLVVGAGLLVRSLLLLERVDPGFRPESGVSFSLVFPDVRYSDENAVRAIENIENRLRTVPGVHAVGAATTLPLRGFAYSGDATVEGRGGEDYERELRHDMITPGYFQAMGTPLIRGRFFNEFDTAKSPPVALVNQTLARVYFRRADPVGRRLKYGKPLDKDEPWVTVVGVVADARQDGLDMPVQPEAWTPLRQQPNNGMTFVLRGNDDPAALIAAARRKVRAVDKDLVLTQVTPLPDLLRESAGDQRFRTALLSAFAGVALLLAALGVYGVLAYSVMQRAKEIGVRMALGAGTARLFGMVLGDGLRPVALGAILGLGGAWLATRMIRSLLFGVAPADPSTYAFTIAVLAIAAVCACTLPAAKAIRVDPVVSLREQ
jgi:putative ABC transport system permease protein